MAKKITGPPFMFKALFVNGQSLSSCTVEGFTNLTVGSTSCKLCRNHMSSATTLRTGEPLWWEHTRTIRCKGIPKTIEKTESNKDKGLTVKKMNEVIEIQEDTELVGTGVILEKGDIVQIMQESPAHSKSSQAWTISNTLGDLGNTAIRYHDLLVATDESTKFYHAVDEAILSIEKYLSVMRKARVSVAQSIKNGDVTLY